MEYEYSMLILLSVSLAYRSRYVQWKTHPHVMLSGSEASLGPRIRSFAPAQYDMRGVELDVMLTRHYNKVD